LAVVGIALSFGFVGGSIWGLVSDRSYIQVSDVPWLDHLFHTAPGLVLLLFVGMFLVFLVLHMAKGIGWLHGRLAEVLLVRL
jgi:uncharacterized membrane protein